jgi:hypothetical protein
MGERIAPTTEVVAADVTAMLREGCFHGAWKTYWSHDVVCQFAWPFTMKTQIKPTGEISVYTVRDGRIVEARCFG